MAFTETRLIDIDDIRGHEKDVSPNIATNKLNNLITSIQREFLPLLFGDEMYYDFFDSDSENDYTDLTNGCGYDYGGYTIKYYGLKPYLVYLWLEKYTLRGDIYHGDAGNYKSLDQENVQFIENVEKRQIASEYRAIADEYKRQIIRYMNDNSSSLPLYFGSETKPATEPSIIKFTSK